MPSSRDVIAAVLLWNRRLHYYLGLYLLCFGWLFALTGLLLNHPKWEFAQFWPNRLQSRIEQPIRAPQGHTDLDRAQDLMLQLGLRGEIQWPARAVPAGPFVFQVTRPGRIVEVRADLRAGRAAIARTELNAWGVMHVLHTFTGVRTGDLQNQRDWLLTSVWAFSMDAVALGLVLMVLSSYVMWYRLPAKRRGGIAALAAGYALCGLFVVGLAWLL
jgi:hypothetical protein